MEGFHLRNHLVWNPGYPGGVPGVPQLGGPAPVLPQGLQLQLPEFGLGLSTAEVRRLNRATLGLPTLPPLGRHGDIVSRERVRCTHPGCSKAFAWPQDLSKHVRKYHSGEPPRFECQREGCGKRFFERKLLVAHERTHTDERPFACPHPGCDKAFRARNALAYHVKALHAESERLRCPEDGCRYATPKKAALAAHGLRHERRAAEKVWKDKAKDEVRAAVKNAKDELKSKTQRLAAARKELAREKKARAKTRRDAAELERGIEKLKKKIDARRAGRDELRRVRTSGSGLEKTNARGREEEEERRSGDVLGVGREGVGEGAARVGAAREDVEDGAREGDGVSGDVAAKRATLARESISPGFRVQDASALDADTGDAHVSRRSETRARRPEIVLLDGADGSKVHAVVVDDDEYPPNARVPGSIPVGTVTTIISGVTRTLRPVCDQALPWSRSFIGCPGIRSARGRDFTRAFLDEEPPPREGPPSNAGGFPSHPTLPEMPNLEVPSKAHARAETCPWSVENLRKTLLRAPDPVSLREVLTSRAVETPSRAKRVDRQCDGCYAARVAQMAAERRYRRNGGDPESGVRVE